MTAIEQGLSIFALGGLNEIGKNMYVVQVEEDIFVVDCGAKFPDESLLGIDLIIQDISYLQENKEHVKALIITHGHEDHIGGIPYFLKQLNLPVYATDLTLGLIEIKLKEHGLLRATELHLIDDKSNLSFGIVNITFFRTNHSIPDCVGIVFHTPVGVVVHTGDFKFDLTPVNNDPPDIHKMAKIGDEGVLVLLSESTNAERPGFNPSEMAVGSHIDEAFRNAQQKVFVSTFASNVHRVQQVVNAAEKTGRKLVLLGRSMLNVVKVASELGHLVIPEGMIIEPYQMKKMDPRAVAILCTGSQGEPLAALSRLASSNSRHAEVHPGDTVILASSPIPGNETNVSRIIDQLFMLKANVIYGSEEGMHVSGHARQEELKLMLTLMKPKYFIPIHGEYRMLYKHRQLAESVGVEHDNIFIVKNGDVVDFDGVSARQTRKVKAGRVFVDGLGVGDVGNMVLRDRRLLSEEGMLVILVTVSKETGQLLSEPDTISRGFVYKPDAKELIEEVNETVHMSVDKFKGNIGSDGTVMRQEIKKSVETLLFERTKRRPMILVFIIEI
ncbi:ribonuclease J [Sporosarcina aquimarina]|uniref:Ribonuclease J n=1 Tax=Sporosarcina aquimarina TaxID=114975 RepID=A0ABU4G2G0_9BACL|nr:ribonuclease J [Sporosarcina aquimarina]MDW0110545.1 ribonuclease J [Sporosarcina aquimarina]